MVTQTIFTKLENFKEDVLANLDAAYDVESALNALRAITLDALLLEQRIRNDNT
jgi:hypothetical protein